MARGWRYTKLSLSGALLLYFFGMCIVFLFLYFCRFCFVVLLSCPRWSFVDVFAGHVPDWQPRMGKTGRPGSSELPRNPLTRWDVSSIPANEIFSLKN